MFTGDFHGSNQVSSLMWLVFLFIYAWGRWAKRAWKLCISNCANGFPKLKCNIAFRDIIRVAPARAEIFLISIFALSKRLEMKERSAAFYVVWNIHGAPREFNLFVWGLNY